jgi:hypothetical protein
VTVRGGGDPEGDPEKNKLLETVGGVQGIIQVSQAVAQKTMTIKAAERLLVEVYGFTPEIANSLIDIPPQTNDGQNQNQ